MMHLRYRQKDSAVHRLSPLTTIIWIAGISTLALVYDHPLYMVLFFLATLPVVAAAKIFREWSSLMKLSLYLCLTIVIFNSLVNNNGAHVLWQAPFRLPLVGAPAVTIEALIFGLGMSLRLFTIISAFSILTLTVHPDDIMLAALKLGFPFKSAMVTALSTRFIPTLTEDAARIADVQRSRGLEMDRGTLFTRTKNRTAVIFPLLSNSLDRAVQVAEAMEARGFGSRSKRTVFRSVKLGWADVLVIVNCVAGIVLGITMRLTGTGDYHYFPSVEMVNLVNFGWVVPFVIVLMFDIIVPLAIMKKRPELDQA